MKEVKRIVEKPSPFDVFVKVAYSKIQFNDLFANKNLERVALDSDVPQVVGQLMKNEDDIRVLKDAVLAFEPNKIGCKRSAHLLTF